MKSLLLLVVGVSVAYAFPSIFAEADYCSSDNCQIEDGCACAKPSSPLGNSSKTPQFVTLTFDDSTTEQIYENIGKLLFNRKNPDGSPVSATLYVPHKYSNYGRVNELYNLGFDIGVNSITKSSADYFANAAADLLVKEFQGQRTIISKFANIPIGDIKGVRTPHFQLNGDETFSSYKTSDLQYDSSWTTLSDKPLFPYTLNYRSNQNCLIGACPTQSYPGFWVAPINNFVGATGVQCNVLHGCQLDRLKEKEAIRDWFIEQYERSYSKLRTPLSFLVNTAYFQIVENGFEGLEAFLDYLATQNNTYMVSHRELIRWSQNPEPLGTYKPLAEKRNQACLNQTCVLPHGDETMYMVSCTECPKNYPWIDNPEGKVV